MTDRNFAPDILSFRDLASSKPYQFSLTPDAPARATLARQLGISNIRKLMFQGILQADGKSDWLLEATLGATVIQPCVVTLAPVSTRIDKPVTRRFIAGLFAPEEGEEVEMPEDETREALPEELDISRIMAEALALALPDYPRSNDAVLETDRFAAPGIAPMTDEDVKPFAGLAGLRDKLGKSE